MLSKLERFIHFARKLKARGSNLVFVSLGDSPFSETAREKVTEDIKFSHCEEIFVHVWEYFSSSQEVAY